MFNNYHLQNNFLVFFQVGQFFEVTYHPKEINVLVKYESATLTAWQRKETAIMLLVRYT